LETAHAEVEAELARLKSEQKGMVRAENVRQHMYCIMRREIEMDDYMDDTDLFHEVTVRTLDILDYLASRAGRER